MRDSKKESQCWGSITRKGGLKNTSETTKNSNQRNDLGKCFFNAEMMENDPHQGPKFDMFFVFKFIYEHFGLKI